jgi:hypothetical protein
MCADTKGENTRFWYEQQQTVPQFSLLFFVGIIFIFLT